MNTKFEHISLEELESDWMESHADILFCEWAIGQGMTEYGAENKKVADRIASNKNIINTIEQEMKDRGVFVIPWEKPTRAAPFGLGFSFGVGISEQK